VRRNAIRWATLLGMAVVLCGLVGCGGPSVEFVASDAAYTSAQTQLVLERTDTSRFEDEPTSEAVALRSKALAQLRSQGEAAARAADLITDTFPPKTRSVPVYVERAVVDGVPSYLIIEAWGPAEGALDRKRLWVIDAETGDVVFSAAAR